MRNQYSNDIEDYKIEHGIDPFVEYKSADDDRKQEIEDWLFNLLRTRNEVPVAEFPNTYIQDKILGFSSLDSHTVYDEKEGVYGLNTECVNIINTYFPEMNDVWKGNGLDHPSINYYFHNDYFLHKICRKTLTYGNNEGDIYGWIKLGGAGYCSNFRPASAKAIYELFGKKENCRVFDSSSGYGARLFGAHFSHNVIEYVGIDPNTKESCDKLIGFLDSEFPTGVKKTVYKMGSEDFTKEGFPQYERYFDLYFTSPPYFDTERYSEDETQSYKKFPSYMGWVDGFYKNTIYNACDALKLDGVFILNIFEKIPKIKEITKMYLADCGWYVFKTDKYMMRTMPGSTHQFDDEGNPIIRDMTIGTNYEPIWYAKHYSQLLKEGSISEEQAEQYKKRVKR